MMNGQPREANGTVKTINLNGTWTLARDGLSKPIKATVPGCVHTDLLKAGIIEDPFFRDNENKLQWIGETDWHYSRRFVVDGDVLGRDRVELCCRGLDTLATIRINKHLAGTTNNMFRSWRFDIKRMLRPGRNLIEITFASTLPYIAKRQEERPLAGWVYAGSPYVRKEPCNYGWDWGPRLITCGVWRDISIEARSDARIADVHVVQDHSQRRKVTLGVSVRTEQYRGGRFAAQATLSMRGEEVGSCALTFRKGTAAGQIPIDRPELWWPAGMGPQPLYDMTVSLAGPSGKQIDSKTLRIGLRTLRLNQRNDRYGRSFEFVVNGIAFFAKGANWIPADTFATRLTRADYERLIGDARAANMNMLRLWGGGIYEQDWFYEICDERGICVWHDFMFSCAAYPAFDREWMANVKAEAEENVGRIRHHCCVALWCGNNELEQGLVGPRWDQRHMGIGDYKRLFDELLPSVVKQLDAQRDYWPSSPHSPRGNRMNPYNTRWGDNHLWGVWHGNDGFEAYEKWYPRFASEFGFQSFPGPKTVGAFTVKQDWNVTSFVMEHHQRSGIGNTKIMQHMLDWFRLPSSFDMTLWLSQILQGLGMKMAVEHWRRSMPRVMGALYWQLNDCWPVASWSSIDSHGRWKALHYMARRFFAPILVSSRTDHTKGAVEVWVTSDLIKAQHGRLLWQLTTLEGTRVLSGHADVIIRAQRSRRACTIDVQRRVERHGKHNLVLWLTLTVAGKTVSENIALFTRPKHLALEKPHLHAGIAQVNEREFSITLSSARPALFAWVAHASDTVRFLDNFVHIPAGGQVEITAHTSSALSLKEFREGIEVRSLVDTYR